MSEGPRERLLHAALRLLASDGPEALQARKLAAEVGASTMAVYTHFGGMPELVEAIVREGFVRFGARLGAIPATDDPVADVFRAGIAYREFALEQPHLYRLMFGIAMPGTLRGPKDLTTERTPTEMPEGQAAFEYLISGVTRMMDAGRIRTGDPAHIAAQIWSALHGYVLLDIAGFFGTAERGVDYVLGPLALNLFVGLGDTLEAATRSSDAARS